MQGNLGFNDQLFLKIICCIVLYQTQTSSLTGGDENERVFLYLLPINYLLQ